MFRLLQEHLWLAVSLFVTTFWRVRRDLLEIFELIVQLITTSSFVSRNEVATSVPSAQHDVGDTDCNDYCDIVDVLLDRSTESFLARWTFLFRTVMHLSETIAIRSLCVNILCIMVVWS